MMFSFEEIGKTAAAALGALLLSSIAIGAAIGPASAAGTAPSVFAAVKSEKAHG